MNTADPMPELQPSSIFEFRPSAIHGTGGFAVAPIRAGTLVIEYVGEQISKAESARRCEAGNPFIFELDDTWDLDGALGENAARFRRGRRRGPRCRRVRK